MEYHWFSEQSGHCALFKEMVLLKPIYAETDLKSIPGKTFRKTDDLDSAEDSRKWYICETNDFEFEEMVQERNDLRSARGGRQQFSEGLHG